VLASQGASETERQVARLNLLRQLDGERSRVLGNLISYEEIRDRAEAEFHERRRQRLISEDQLAQLLLRSNAQYLNSYVNGVGQGISALAQAWPKQKSFAIAQAITSTLAGATRAFMDLPTWLAIPTSAAILAAGFKNVATIRSTNPGSSAGGGGSTPSLGSGVAPESGPSGPARSVTIQGFDPAGLFSGAMIERIVAGVNEAVGNGTVLISTSTKAL
jgi:hypothetical protein